MAYSDVQTAMAAAVAALEDGDYDIALTKAMAAQGYMAVLPSGGMASGAPGGAQHTMEWDSKKIQDFITNLRRRQGASAGLQRTRIDYVAPTLDSDA